MKYLPKKFEYYAEFHFLGMQIPLLLLMKRPKVRYPHLSNKCTSLTIYCPSLQIRPYYRFEGECWHGFADMRCSGTWFICLCILLLWSLHRNCIRTLLTFIAYSLFMESSLPTEQMVSISQQIHLWLLP